MASNASSSREMGKIGGGIIHFKATALMSLLMRLRGGPNKSLQVTFDPPPPFAIAKGGGASNAPEPRR